MTTLRNIIDHIKIMMWLHPVIFETEIDLKMEIDPSVGCIEASQCREYVFGCEDWVRAMFLNVYYMIYQELEASYGDLHGKRLECFHDLIESTKINLFNTSDFLFYRRTFDCLMCTMFGAQTYFDFARAVR